MAKGDARSSWSAGLTGGPHASNLRPEHCLTPPINTTMLPLTESVMKVKFSPPQWAFKFNLCRVERERGEVLRAGGLPRLSGVLGVARAWKICQNLFGFDGVFRALVRSSVEALPKLCEFRQRADSRVPLVDQDLSLSGYTWYYLRVGDLSIIISHSFTSLMLFVHLHTV
jgi:hypothetical protein